MTAKQAQPTPMQNEKRHDVRYVSATVLKAYAEEVLVTLGARGEEVSLVADSMVYADLQGTHSFGVGALYNLIHLVRAGRVLLQGEVNIAYQSPSTATLDGGTNLGVCSATRAMQLAMEKARTTGVGMVAVRNSTNLGAASYIARQALEQGMVGICMSNGAPIVAPVYSTVRMLGANPLAVAIPTLRHPSLIFDFSTSPVTHAELAHWASQGERAPQGLLQDALGVASSDPETIERGGAIRPLGGEIATGGYKGFCISALIDIFSSLFSGASFGPFVPSSWAFFPSTIFAPMQGEGIGHMILAIRTDAFRPAKEFTQAVDSWIDTFLASRGIEDTPGVMIPGFREHQLQQVRMKTGIPLPAHIVLALERVSHTLKLSPLLYTEAPPPDTSASPSHTGREKEQDNAPSSSHIEEEAVE